MSIAVLVTKNTLSISITSEKMISKKCNISLLESFELRCKNLQNIIKSFSNIKLEVKLKIKILKHKK